MYVKAIKLTLVNHCNSTVRNLEGAVSSCLIEWGKKKQKEKLLIAIVQFPQAFSTR